MKTSRLIVGTMLIFISIGVISIVTNYNNKSEKDTKKSVYVSQQLLLPSVVEEPEVIEPEIVIDDLTLDELGEKLEKSLNSTLVGQGYNFASYAIELGLDPYLSLAIVLEETGCTWGCSYLVNACNNIGGQKGTGCGEYQYFDSLDDGIKGFLNNIKKNYYDYGLTTADSMNPKYAENPLWSTNVNAYIEKIKNK